MRIFKLGLAACLFGAAGCSASSLPQSHARAITASADCDRVANPSRAASGLFASGEVYAAREATEAVPVGRAGTETRGVGAELYVHATPGTTGEYLQRMLECYTVYGMSVTIDDPFHPGRGFVRSLAVRSAGDSFSVRVVGSDRDAAQDIWKRAQALTSASIQVDQVGAATAPKTQF